MIGRPDPLCACMIGDREPMGDLRSYRLQPLPEMNAPAAQTAAMLATLALGEIVHMHAVQFVLSIGDYAGLRKRRAAARVASGRRAALARFKSEPGE